MNIHDLFPTKWLTPADLKGRSVVVVIDHVSVQDVYNPRTRQLNKKLAVSFRGAKKQMLLNKTQAFAMAAVCQSLNVEEWEGHRVQLNVGVAPNKAETIVVSEPANETNNKEDL